MPVLLWQSKVVSRAQERLLIFLLALWLALFMPLASTDASELKYNFKIKSQRADKALIKFARKVDMPVLFPNDQISGRYTNALTGRYSLNAGIDILLEGTGLKARSDRSGQLIIEVFSEPEEDIVIPNKKKTSLFAAIFGAAVVSSSPTVSGQENSESKSQRSTIEQITVTAQYRAQSIQDVPISISAIGAEELEAANIFDASSLSFNVPGFTYGEFAPGQALISLRGVNSADDGAGLDNSAALFLDGVYIGRGAGINFDLFDLERIEVLKGPQGTLFGRNAIGGAISVVTSKPTEEFEGKAALTIGNEGIVRYQGLISGGLADGLSGKLVVNHREHDGFVRNVLLGLDVQDEDQDTVRGQLRWETGRSDWLLSADYFEDSRTDAGRVPIAGPFFDNGVAPSLGVSDARQNASPIQGFSDRETGGISLQGDISFDGGTLTTITAFRSVETDWEMPSIGAPIGPDLAAGVFGIDVNDDIEEEIDTFSQELRWTSGLDGSFNYVLGAYYLVEDTDRQEQFRLDRNSQATGQVTIGNEFTRTENETTSYALYGQGTWEINDKTSLIFGARYSRDERDYQASAINCALSDAEILAAGFANNANCVFGGNRVGGSLAIISEVFIEPAEVDFDDVSPRLSLQYRPNENVMYFVTASTGYKAGGFAGSQGVASAATTVVDPEEVTNLEIGLKGDFLDNTLRFNATLFTADYDDLQVVRFGPVPNSSFGSFQTTNIGSADLSGVELDFAWYILLVRKLRLS